MNDKDLQHLAAIVRDSDDAIIGQTLEGIITSWNRGAERIYGYTAEEAIGRTVALIIPVDRPDELPHILRNLTEGTGSHCYDTLHVTKGGSLVNISLNVSPIYDDQGAIVAASTIGRDVTGQKETEEALRESARAYRLLMEQAPDAILVGYPDQPLIEVNQQACDLLGYTREELLQLAEQGGNPLADLGILPPRLAGLEGNTVYAGPDMPQAVGTLVVTEQRLQRKDGTAIVIELSMKRLADGRIVTMARDITEREQVEQALRQSEQRYRQMFQTDGSLQLLIDPTTWGIVEANPGATAFYGYSMQDLTGLKITDLSLTLDAQRAVTLAEAWSRGGVHVIGRHRIASGEIRDIEVHGGPVDIGGRRLLYGILSDITERKQTEHALRASEERFRQAFDHAGIGMSLVALDGRWLQVNASLCAILGYTEAELLTKTFQEMTHPDDLATDIKQAAQLLAGEITYYHMEKRYFHKNGHALWILLSVSLVRDPNGTPLHFISQVQDISQRKQAQEALVEANDDLERRIARRTAELRASNDQLHHELTERRRTQEALRVSEEQFRAIFEHAPVMINSFTEDHHCVLWNRECEKQLGYTKADLIASGDAFLLLYPDSASRERVRAALILKDGQFREYRARAVDGTDHDQMWADFTLPNSDLISIGYDITERKRTEEQLRRASAELQAVLRAFPDLYFRVRLDGTILDYKASYSGDLYVPPEAEAFLDKRVQDVLPPDVAQQCAEAMLQATSQNSLVRIEYSLPPPNEKQCFEARLLPLLEEQVIIIIRDITHRKAAEAALLAAKTEAETANQAKSAFLSRMSHELRTPLNAILGFAQLLEMNSLTPEQEESTDHILKAGRHLLDMINEVLEIARIEEGGLSLAVEPVFLRDVLQESLNLIERLAAQGQVTLHADLAGLDGCYVMADRRRLLQVLLNLLSNAIKYNWYGGEVHLSCQMPDHGEPESTAPTTLRILVRDTGIGIAPAQMARLFIPFERLGAEQTDVEGIGLGLALSRHLVEAMSGTIGAFSEPDQGSTFWLELPLAQEPAVQLEPEGHEQAVPAQAQMPGGLVLYIEDNLSNIQLITRILGRHPEITLITATEGGAGLDLAYARQPDLILLDLQLPDLTGQAVLHQLREDPQTAAIPVVVLSADANPRQSEQLLTLGAQAYLTKPLDVNQVLKVVEEILAGVSVS